jgi:sigma-B regulation protein RsbU (phosphoserine phosphatase)
MVTPTRVAGTRPRPWRSVRWIVTGVAVLLTTTAVLSVGVISERNARDALTRELQMRLLLQARSLAAAASDALLGDFPELTLHALIRKLSAEQPELALVVVLDHEGRVRGHQDARQLDSRFAMPGSLRAVAEGRVLEPGEALETDGRLLLAVTPVRQANGRVIGQTIVGLSSGYVDRTIGAARRQQALLLTLLLAAGVAIAFASMSRLLKPVSVVREGLERIAHGDLDTPIQVRTRTEFGLLAHTVNDMASALKSAQRSLVERERLAREMELAREVQIALLPPAPVRAGRMRVRGDHRAASEVGGDYYDVRPLADGRLAIAIADVSGKGLGACMVMGMLSALQRSLRELDRSPAALLARLDRHLVESLQPGVFVTMFYGIVDPASGQVVYASAGHNPSIVYRSSGEIERLTGRGIPLRAMRCGQIAGTLADLTVELGPGDLMVQYTDGFTEAFAPLNGEPFGLDRMEEIVRAAGSRGGDALIAALHEAVDDWSGGAVSDDRTVLVLECLGAAIAEVRENAPAEAPAEAGGADEAEVLNRLAEAEAQGSRLDLRGDLDSLAAIRAWACRLPGLDRLRGPDIDLIVSALYEACANVAEHGCGGDPATGFELWWVPRGDGTAPSAPLPYQGPLREVRGGHFVIRDSGKPFRPGPWVRKDLGDTRLWKRGRGLGLEIMHRVMRQVDYHPGTSRGNITIMAFGPREPVQAGAT